MARRDAGIDATPEPPGPARKAANLVGAVAHHLRAGWRHADEGEARRRLAICESCPNLTPSRGCRLCGCRMDVKVRWADMACPIGLWGVSGTTSDNPGEILTRN